MSSLPPDFLTNDPLPIYYPRPFNSSYPRNNQPTQSSGSSGSSPSSGSSGSGVAYASALFINATCLSTDAVGNWVRAADAANAVTTTTSQLSYPAIGVIVSKSTDTACVVQTYGLCQGIYSGMTPNLRLFVGVTGSAVPGSALNDSTAYVQPIAFSVRGDTLFVQPSGTLYRRDAAPASNDPAPAPSGDSTSTYRPILTGVGSPDPNLGSVNDLYVASDTLQIFGPKTDSGWGAGQSLINGGQRGASTLTGSSPPSDALGQDGDTFILLDSSGQAVTYYGQKTNGHWPTSGTSLVGPAGADAPPAPTITGGEGPPDPNNVGVIGSLYLDRASSTVDLYQAQA